jgi:hypothetical protein
MSNAILERSRALWNRSSFDLRSDETLAQILDRGSLPDFRELYRLASSDASLRHRIRAIVEHVPLPLPYFWLAALASLGEPVDFDHEAPSYAEHTGI